MKAFWTMFIVALFSIGTTAVASDFRNVTWKMNKEQVKEAETEAILKEEKDRSLFFETKVAGLKVILVYAFNDQALIGAAYRFSCANGKQCLKNYFKIDHLLEGKYGQRGFSHHWVNEVYETELEDFDDYWAAFRQDRLDIYKEWKTENTEIDHWINGIPQQPNHILRYTEIDAAQKIEKYFQQEKNKNL